MRSRRETRALFNNYSHMATYWRDITCFREPKRSVHSSLIAEIPMTPILLEHGVNSDDVFLACPMKLDG